MPGVESFSLHDPWMTFHCPLLLTLQMRTPGLAKIFSLEVPCSFCQQACSFPHPGCPIHPQDFRASWVCEGEGKDRQAPVGCVGDSNGDRAPSVVLSSPPRVLVDNVLLEHSQAYSCSFAHGCFHSIAAEKELDRGLTVL